MFRYLVFIVALCCFAPNVPAQQQRFAFSAEKMGSPFNLILYAGDSIQANNAAKQAFELVDSLVFIFSDYIDSSELNRLCARVNTPVKLSDHLYEILLISRRAFVQSKGTFDITLGPVTRLWRKARKEKQFPADALVKERLELTGYDKWKLDTVARTATMLIAGMQLDLGGIAQGYIAQQVIDFLQMQGIQNALTDVSGDIVACGAPPGTAGWTIGVNVPESAEELLPEYLLISNKAVTTSGDVYQFMEHNGKKYSHVTDPRTGYGITSQKNVTVIASDGTTADWLTKACALLPFRSAKKLVASYQAALLIATLKKGKVKFAKSKRFDEYWKAKTG